MAELLPSLTACVRESTTRGEISTHKHAKKLGSLGTLPTLSLVFLLFPDCESESTACVCENLLCAHANKKKFLCTVNGFHKSFSVTGGLS